MPDIDRFPEQDDVCAGLLWAWWRGDTLPFLLPLTGFAVEDTPTDHVVVDGAHLGLDEVNNRRAAGHRPYIARIEEHIVGYGWSASNAATFGVPSVEFTIPTGVRYLRDFGTQPAWCGRGVYPRLMQAIIAHEAQDAGQFWILHQWQNHASARGIARAGFGVVCQICFLPAGRLGLLTTGSYDRANVGAALLGLPLIDESHLHASA